MSWAGDGLGVFNSDMRGELGNRLITIRRDENQSKRWIGANATTKPSDRRAGDLPCDGLPQHVGVKRGAGGHLKTVSRDRLSC